MFKPDIAFVTVKLLVLFKIMIINANLTEQEINTFTYLFLAYYLLFVIKIMTIGYKLQVQF